MGVDLRQGIAGHAVPDLGESVLRSVSRFGGVGLFCSALAGLFYLAITVA